MRKRSSGITRSESDMREILAGSGTQQVDRLHQQFYQAGPMPLAAASM